MGWRDGTGKVGDMSESAPVNDTSQSSSGPVMASSGSGSLRLGRAGGSWPMSVGAVGTLVLYWIVMAASNGPDPLQFARMMLTALTPLVAFYLVILMAARYQAVAVVVAFAGVGGIV